MFGTLSPFPPKTIPTYHTDSKKIFILYFLYAYLAYLGLTFWVSGVNIWFGLLQMHNIELISDVDTLFPRMKLEKVCEKQFDPWDVNQIIQDEKHSNKFTFLCDTDDCNWEIDDLLDRLG